MIAQPEVTKRESVPEWVSFDGQAALQRFDQESSLYIQESANNTFPEWLQLDTQSEVSSSVVEPEQKEEDVTPVWLQFDVAEELSSTTQIENKEEQPSWLMPDTTEEQKPDQPSSSFPQPVYNSHSTTVSSRMAPLRKPMPMVEQTVTMPPQNDVVLVDYDAQASAGLARINRVLDSMDSVTNAIARHMLACNGTDGHRGKIIAKEAVSQARESALLNVMNTNIGKKLSKGEELDDQEKQALNEIVSLSYETELDIDTSAIRNNAVDLSNFEQISMLMPNLIPEHVHGVGCNHGGSIDIGVDIGGGAGSIFTEHSALETILGQSGHEHHDRLFYCDSCKKASKLHIHTEKDIKCPGCDSSRNLRELKGRKH